MKLSRFFTLDELTYSKTAQDEGIDNQPGSAEIESLKALCSAVLDPLREAVGKPIHVTSGYRGPALNLRLKGAAKSQHLNGQAADLQSPGMAVIELFKMVIRLMLPFDQIIYEVKGTSKWVHVSHNPGANGGEILLAKFGADGGVTYPRITAQQALEMTEPVTRSAEEPGYVETADEPEREVTMTRGAAAPAPSSAPTAKAPAARKAPAKKAPTKAARRKPAAKKTATKKAPARKGKATRAATKKVVARKAAPKSAVAKKASIPAGRRAKATAR
jgi:hypothetical protein